MNVRMNTLRNFRAHTVQIANMFWLAAIDPENPPQSFVDFFEGQSTADMQLIFEDLELPDLDNYEDDEFARVVLEHLDLAEKNGFIAVLNIPLKTGFTEHGCMAHRAITHCPIIYADTLDDLMIKAVELAEKLKESDRQEYEAAMRDQL